MKVYLNPGDFVCECGSHLYVEKHGEFIHVVCASISCEDFGIQKAVRCIEIPFVKLPTKPGVVYEGLDLGEEELKKRQAEERELAKEARNINNMRMFSG